jgi:putative Holliday junction resolvase
MSQTSSDKADWHKLMGFDFGTTKRGIATGQTITQTAQPLKPIAAKSGQPNWETLAELIKQWKPEALIVGLPLNMDGTEQQVTQQAKKFANRLQGRFGLPVELQDERLTTVDARSEIFAREGKKGIDSRSIDSLAACLILENWLEQNA